MKATHRTTLAWSTTRRGFTIVELLIVIVVIAILAAIIIVSYNGIRERAIETSLKSDLRNGASTLEVTNATDGSYPDDEASAGLKSSGDNTISYHRIGTEDYCIEAANGDIVFRLPSSTGKIEPGTCDGGASQNEGNVTTVAGSTQGYLDDSGIIARFNSPTDVAIGSSGMLYVTDTGNNRIRTVTSTGVVTTFAGSGAAGTVNGTGTSTLFDAPTGIAINQSGFLFVTDSEGNVVRRISPTANVITFAGSGTAGYQHGTGTSSSVRFNYPFGIDIDGTGNLYVTDVSNHNVRLITSGAVVSLYSGNSLGTPGLINGNDRLNVRYNYPNGVAVDSAGNVFIADRVNHQIRRITPAGVVSTFAGSTSPGFIDGSGSSARFNNPAGIAIGDDGILYVADTGNNAIRTITADGVVDTLAGGTQGTANGSGTEAQFNSPVGLDVAPDGTVYVVDTGNHRIRKIK